jgi:hypothetical protein
MWINSRRKILFKSKKDRENFEFPLHINSAHTLWARIKNTKTNLERTRLCRTFDSGTVPLIKLPESRVSQWFSVQNYPLYYDVKQDLILFYHGQVTDSFTYAKSFTLERCICSYCSSVDWHKNKIQKPFTLQSWINTAVPPLLDTRTRYTTTHSSVLKKHRGTSVTRHTNTLHNHSLFRAKETPRYLR